jgi:hypothetical protein
MLKSGSLNKVDYTTMMTEPGQIGHEAENIFLSMILL